MTHLQMLLVALYRCHHSDQVARMGQKLLCIACQLHSNTHETSQSRCSIPRMMGTDAWKPQHAEHDGRQLQATC